jgi:DNA-binding MarR family transcriptional regulator
MPINKDIDKWLYTQSWIQFTQLNNNKINLEEVVGHKVSNIEHKVLCCIAYCPATRTGLMKNKYFKGVSLSTMKRAVTELLKSGIVVVVVDKNDRRRKILTLVNKT